MPHQTCLGAEKTLFLRKNAPSNRGYFLSVGPEPTGNPSKNPKKHLKKPLPPVRCTAVGREEGGRLDSQITLSRNQTKYTQGKNSELRAILEKARRRSEKKKASSTEELDNKENSFV